MNPVYEWIGYAGSALVAVSLMMKNILHLRQINFIGASIFAFYGYLVGAYPVVFLNGFIALVDVYYLVNMYKQTEHFSLMPVLDKSHKYLNKFLDFYEKDIRKYFPLFNREETKDAECFFILRDLRPVGLFIHKKVNDAESEILLEYAIPDYRDTKNGRFVYNTQSSYLKKEGIKKIITYTDVETHKKYLKRVGFKEDKQKPGTFGRNI